MKSFFGLITKLALRFRAITLAVVAAFMILGVTAITQFKLELIPSIEFPATIILTQVSGMTSEQVLTVITKRFEDALSGVDDIVNLETTTTGSFGSVIQALNDFGPNQARVRDQIRDALDGVWFPLRYIQAAGGETADAFANRLLGDLTPDVLIFLAQNDPNFLFQLTPEVWQSLSDDTLRTALAYLAAQTKQSQPAGGALQRLVDQEIVPQLEAIKSIASVDVSGGQKLPGEQESAVNIPVLGDSEDTSLLLQLSPKVWEVVSARAGNLGALNADAVAALRDVAFTIPEVAPALPESWQMDHFFDATDLLEVPTLTRNIAGVFNSFRDEGYIAGALGQTNDLTPEIVTRMLELDPTLVEYFEAEQLAAMPADVFAVLPDEFIAGLDGFTRDALVAASVAESITGQKVEPTPVDLPSAWRIQPPQLLTFGFDDMPLASYSVSSNGHSSESETVAAANDPANADSTDETVPVDNPTTSSFTLSAANFFNILVIFGNPDASFADINMNAEMVNVEGIPEGPALPPIFAAIGTQFGITLDTADDLINIPLPDSFSQQMSSGMTQQSPLPFGMTTSALIQFISPDAIAFIAEYDPTFLPNLSPDVYDAFSDAVLSLPQVAPLLGDAWDTLAGQPQFVQVPLRTAVDVLALGKGQASEVLNQINASVPEQFAGYEVRLFDSLSTGAVRYFALQEPDFYAHLDAQVLEKLSPQVLALLPEDVLAGLAPDVATTLTAIAAGEQESAAQKLASLYTTNLPPADPDAPQLNALWGQVGGVFGIELDTADDFFRFPQGFQYATAADLMNDIMSSAQGVAFAPGLYGSFTPEVISYMLQRDPAVFDAVISEVLQLFPEDALAALPQDVQDHAVAQGEPFKPTAAITRTNGNSSLLVTVYKAKDANTVEAFHTVDDALAKIDAEDDAIAVGVAFEQASFIEESVEGVAREGGLGGIFAIVIILAFLSTGLWSRSPRRIAGIIMVALFLALLVIFTLASLQAADNDLKLAFEKVDMVVRVLLILGMISGLLVWLWPANLPYPAWRSTLVVSVSIPLSLLMAFMAMRWLPAAVHDILAPAAETSSLMAFIIHLFPESVSLNILTLSGLTVAIGRIVDDSIVVLENITREVQAGGDKRQAVITGTRDVSVAIFAATIVTAVVFLPLGLTGGIIGEMFLPFGLAVTYSLASSFIVAITVVPVLAYLFVGTEGSSEKEHESWLERLYAPILRWSLASRRNKAIVLIIAGVSMLIGFGLFATRPMTFMPPMGEPQITVSVSLPPATKMLETNDKVMQLEQYIQTAIPAGELGAVETTIGGGGNDMSSLFVGGVSENTANITIGIESSGKSDDLAQQIRTQAETIFGKDYVKVSAATITEQGFGDFAVVLSGPQDELEAINQSVIDTLSGVEGLANVESNLADGSGSSDDGPITYIRIDGESALQYSGELETEDTLGVTSQAVEAIKTMPDLPADIKVSQGFTSEIQVEGFRSLFVAMGIAIIIVVVVLIVTFGSLVHWFDIILSIVVAPVGAAVALTLSNRVLGISALIGLLMLIGIVVTNAVVLIDRVQANRRERHMNVHDSLIEAGGRRLRPILMTALATIFALLPLAVGLSKGAIIASELGVVVIGGLFTSTILTLIVVPVAYSLLHPLHIRVARLFGQGKMQ